MVSVYSKGGLARIMHRLCSTSLGIRHLFFFPFYQLGKQSLCGTISIAFIFSSSITHFACDSDSSPPSTVQIDFGTPDIKALVDAAVVDADVQTPREPGAIDVTTEDGESQTSPRDSSTNGMRSEAGDFISTTRDASIPTLDASSENPADAVVPPIDVSVSSEASTTLYENQLLIPHASWTCSMPGGIPPPQSGILVFKATIQLGEVYDMGQTQFGHRQVIEISNGTAIGPNIEAEFLSGGLDFQLDLSNGAVEVEQLNVLRTTDGTLIYFRSCGISPSQASEVRMVPDFEAPNSSKYNWLNTGQFVGTRELDMANLTCKMAIYDVQPSIYPAESVQVLQPEDVPDQTWECVKLSGTFGAEVYKETVGIGGMLTLGASKRGTRNIIPITGGTTTGRIEGTVLPGGADFQLMNDAGFEIDARYMVRTNDGELIIVRNCGLVGALVPVFETRIDGNYAWINENTWLSSNPGIGIGSVTLTIYEAR